MQGESAHLKSMDQGGAVQPNVLIAGAGFAGLAAAYWMQQLGYAVTVIEVAAAVKKGGTPVNIREGVIDAVTRMGLLERIKDQRLPDRPQQWIDRNGLPESVTGFAQVAMEDAGEDYEIERDVLLDMLSEQVQGKVEFLFSDSISTVEQTADEVAVTFASGGQRSFSLLLGCDGTHSTVRRMCFGPESAYTHFMQCYFSLTIAEKLLLPEDTSQMFRAPGRTVMLNAYNGKTDIAFCYNAEEEVAYDRRDREAQRQMVMEHFRGMGWRIPELLQEMKQTGDFYFDKLVQIRMDRWSEGRVALVGDAAYCPSPAAGLGGSMAILGATALADALAKYPGDHVKAFQQYDDAFRPEAEEIQRNAIDFGMAIVMLKADAAAD